MNVMTLDSLIITMTCIRDPTHGGRDWSFACMVAGTSNLIGRQPLGRGIPCILMWVFKALQRGMLQVIWGPLA